MNKIPVVLKNHSKPIGKYSPAIVISPKPGDRFIFITGQVATDASGNVIGEGNPELQTQEVFQRLSALLTEAGGSISDLVSVTLFISDREHFKSVSKVRDSWFADVVPPASTMVVAELMEKGCLVEINGIAVLPSN